MREGPLKQFFEEGRGNPHAFRYYVRLGRIQAWLEENYAADVSVRAAASVAGLNEKYFSRFFRQKTGVRYSEWVNAVRIDRATRMIRRRNHSITTVAFEIGYQDLRTFERVFKRYTGMTPRDFRDRVRPDSRYPARAVQARQETTESR